MGKVYENITELVGNTPLLKLNNLEKQNNTVANLYAKLECYNPGGSVKDRIALNMIEAAERDGILKPGGTIIESTSGNTGIGLAAIAAAKGYKAIICMPEDMSKERVSILKGYGAEVVLTPAKDYMPGSNQKADEIAAATENSFLVGQGYNPHNPEMHMKTTGPEIWNDLDGHVDIFIAAVGTGGTITGAGQFLKSKNPNVEIICVEPASSPVLSGGKPGVHKIQGIGPVEPCKVLDQNIYNEVITVKDEDAYETSRKCATVEGMSIGISAGAILWAAIQVAKREENKGKNIVFVFPDKGERYISSGLYD
jgi:cysteine synthase A